MVLILGWYSLCYQVTVNGILNVKIVCSISIMNVHIADNIVADACDVSENHCIFHRAPGIESNLKPSLRICLRITGNVIQSLTLSAVYNTIKY